MLLVVVEKNPHPRMMKALLIFFYPFSFSLPLFILLHRILSVENRLLFTYQECELAQSVRQVDFHQFLMQNLKFIMITQRILYMLSLPLFIDCGDWNSCPSSVDSKIASESIYLFYRYVSYKISSDPTG